MTPWARRIDQIEPGHFRVKQVKSGPWVPARIVHENGVWSAWVGGRLIEPKDADPYKAGAVSWVWERGHVITPEQYDDMVRTAEWARRERPEHPAANPNQPVDLDRLPPLF